MTNQNGTNDGIKSTALQYIRTIYLSLAAVIGLICFIFGATGAIKLGLNYWFPVDEYIYFSAPYERANCEIKWIDGKETRAGEEEIEKCVQQTRENNALMAKNNFNRELTQSVALLLVGFPVWFLHFWLIQRDWKRRSKN
jgi:hypothetical protein